MDQRPTPQRHVLLTTQIHSFANAGRRSNWFRSFVRERSRMSSERSWPASSSSSKFFSYRQIPHPYRSLPGARFRLDRLLLLPDQRLWRTKQGRRCSSRMQEATKFDASVLSSYLLGMLSTRALRPTCHSDPIRTPRSPNWVGMACSPELASRLTGSGWRYPEKQVPIRAYVRFPRGQSAYSC